MLGSYSSRIWHAGTHRACDRLAHRSSKPTICVLHARKHPFITCSSASSASSSGSKPVSRQRKGTAASSSAAVSGPSSMPLVTASATVAAATVTAVEQTTAAPPAESIPVVNPPLGFANNIVPARPLVVTHPSPSPDLIISSDEELDASSSPFAGRTGPVGGGTGRSSAWRCLVLDSRYLPVNVVPWGRAVVMDLSGKVDVLEYHPGGYAFSAYKQHPLPAVLRVRTFVDVHEFAGRLALTRKNIMLRDHHCCQYCGSTRELTLDHIVPVCRGGLNTWQNLVTACMACNQRKGDKSLQQLGWKLPSIPREPTPQEVGVVAGISKADLERPPQPWEPYLATFKAALEKAQKRAAAAAKSIENADNMDSFFAEQQQQLLKGSDKASTARKASAASAATGKKAPRRIRN